MFLSESHLGLKIGWKQIYMDGTDFVRERLDKHMSAAPSGLKVLVVVPD